MRIEIPVFRQHSDTWGKIMAATESHECCLAVVYCNLLCMGVTPLLEY